MNGIVLWGVLTVIFLPAIAAVITLFVSRMMQFHKIPLRISLEINQLFEDLKTARPWIRFYTIPAGWGIHQTICWGNSPGITEPFVQMRVEKVQNRKYQISWYANSIRRVLNMEIYKGYPGLHTFVMPGHYEGFHVCGNRAWKLGLSFRSPLIWAWCDLDRLEIRIRSDRDREEYYELHSRKYGLLMPMRTGVEEAFGEETEVFIGGGKVFLGELEYRKIADDPNAEMYLEIITIMMFLFLLVRYLMKRTDVRFRRWFLGRDDYDMLWGHKSVKRKGNV